MGRVATLLSPWSLAQKDDGHPNKTARQKTLERREYDYETIGDAVLFEVIPGYTLLENVRMRLKRLQNTKNDK